VHVHGGRRLAPGFVQHRLALVEPDDLSRQMPCEETGSAGDVECARGRQRPERADESGEFFLPPVPVALREAPDAEVPVVVLGGPSLVVGLHGS
jgi:hypothetical protein